MCRLMEDMPRDCTMVRIDNHHRGIRTGHRVNPNCYAITNPPLCHDLLSLIYDEEDGFLRFLSLQVDEVLGDFIPCGPELRLRRAYFRPEEDCVGGFLLDVVKVVIDWRNHIAVHVLRVHPDAEPLPWDEDAMPNVIGLPSPGGTRDEDAFPGLRGLGPDDQEPTSSLLGLDNIAFRGLLPRRHRIAGREGLAPFLHHQINVHHQEERDGWHDDDSEHCPRGRDVFVRILEGIIDVFSFFIREDEGIIASRFEFGPLVEGPVDRLDHRYDSTCRFHPVGAFRRHLCPRCTGTYLLTHEGLNARPSSWSLGDGNRFHLKSSPLVLERLRPDYFLFSGSIGSNVRLEGKPPPTRTVFNLHLHFLLLVGRYVDTIVPGA